ncbi:MAG TPA: hypothetical protein VFN75_00850 [Pseudonocardiaceae bacterium]|nr:hypothetical protein [Pseudonocardiaceae bacterium]
MRVSEIFARGGSDYGYDGHYERYLNYGGVDKPGGYYPDTGRWTYVNPDSYNYKGCGYGYGYSRSHGLDGLVG